MNPSHVAAFIAGSWLAAILAATVFIQVSGIRLDLASDTLRVLRAVQAVAMGALLVVFVLGAFGLVG
jgi:hypothetical protein